MTKRHAGRGKGVYSIGFRLYAIMCHKCSDVKPPLWEISRLLADDPVARHKSAWAGIAAAHRCAQRKNKKTENPTHARGRRGTWGGVTEHG